MRQKNRNEVKGKLYTFFIVLILIGAGLSIFLLTNIINLNVSAGVTWTQTSDRDFDNGTSVNLTIVGTGDDAELQIDFSDMHNWQDMNPTSSVGNLAYHNMATIYGTTKVMAFGGGTAWNNFDNETYEYDIVTNTWTNTNPTTAPSNRGELGLASIYGTDKVLMFGGGLSWNNHIGDTWIYDSSDGAWSPETPPTSPSARSSMGMAELYGTDKVILFGGMNAWNSFFDETWEYDLSEGTWTNLSIISTKPSPRAYINMVNIYGTDKIVLFGGMAGWNTYTDETWVFDYGDMTWTKVALSSTKPNQRMSNAIATIYNDDKVMVHGGQSAWNSGYRGDTWVFDYSDDTWTEIEPRDSSKTPSTRTKVAAAMVDGQESIILYGGMAGWNSFRSDTWKYKHYLPLKNGTYESGAHDTGTNSDFYDITWFYTPIDNTTISAQIRTATNSSLLSSKPFVGPDGTSSTFYTESKFILISQLLRIHLGYKSYR
jgi:hypothetical protein